ncbi:MAG: M43 family zinc metalloprotease [Bacteroidia bacterium]
MSRILLIPVILFLITLAVQAQQPRTCSTMEVFALEKANDPLREGAMEKIERQMQKWIEENENSASKKIVITIPVVVHILYNNTAQNITDAQIFSQIDVLNEDFRKLNADISLVPSVWQSVAADVEIEFCLATKDPTGNTTNGITRTFTNTTSFGTNNNIKFNSTGGKDIWNRDEYLNMWVGNLTGGLLGYAQFPGGAAATDGIVCHYLAFGRIGTLYSNYNLGRTATHEIGHWLNLRHIWGDDGNGCTGTDFVNDTPNQAGNNCCCPTFPLLDACTPSSPGVMFMNYMDYTYDNCMYMFTNGQAQRMLAALNGPRASLLTSQGCAPLVSLDAGILKIITPSGSSCNTSFTPQVELRNFGSNPLTSVNIHYQLNAGPVSILNWTGNLPAGSTTIVNLSVQTVGTGNHIFTAFTNLPNGGIDGYTGNDSQTNSFTVLSPIAGQSIPFFQGFDANTFPPAGWVLDNPNSNNTWERVTSANGFGTSTACARMDNYSGVANISGQSDLLYAPALNFSTETPPLSLEFSVAYARYSNVYYDSLFVLASEDCGATWSRIYSKGNNPALATANDITAGFVPTTSQWRKESINLDSYAGKSNVKFAFEAKSGWGNYCYVDDINIYKQQVLPVELLSFTGDAERKTIRLSWTTATEKDNEKFVLQKSADGFYYNELSEIPGKGNTTSISNYEFIDRNPLNGINYYRLIQQDFDGKTNEAGVVAVNFSLVQTDIILYPNPDNTGEISVLFKKGLHISSVECISIDGRLQPVVIAKENDRLKINHSLPAGVYFISLILENEIFYKKLIIH